MRVQALTREQIDAAIDDLARLRITVFHDWPYLYDGDLAYERNYLSAYTAAEKSIVLGAFDGDWLVGASTGAPLADHATEFGDALARTDLDIPTCFYFGESVLLRAYRGRGAGKQFFSLRESHARRNGFSTVCFCAVIRPDDHPLRPAVYRPLDGFWQSLGYHKLDGAIARFPWKDVDSEHETMKPLQMWVKSL